jgi:hypothetical protein
MAEGSKVGRMQAHLSEYVSRYAVLASIVLVPLAGIIGDLAAQVGPDTKLGHTLLSVASALGTAAAIVVWLRNRGLFETAPIAAASALQTAAAAASMAAVQAGGAAGIDMPPEVESLDTLPDLEDPEAEAVLARDLPSDEVEFASPPPDDDTTTPRDPGA